MPRAVIVVLSNSDPDRDEEFNRWYDHEHMPAVLEADGQVRARRYRLATTQVRHELQATHTYLAIYEVEADDVEAAIADFRNRAMSMPRSDAAQDDALSLVYDEIYVVER